MSYIQNMLAIVFVSYFLFILAHLALIHLFKVKNQVVLFPSCYVVFLSLMLIASCSLSGSGSLFPVMFSNGMMFSGLVYGYFTLFNLNISSLRIRVLKEVYAEGELELDKLLANYNSKTIVENRLERLLRGRQIIIKDQKLYIGTPVFLILSVFLDVPKKILLRKKIQDL